MKMNHKRMAVYTDRIKKLGGVIHVSPRGGLCIHESPTAPGDHWEPTGGSDQHGADWLLALTAKTWPDGLPGCPSNALRPDDAA